MPPPSKESLVHIFAMQPRHQFAVRPPLRALPHAAEEAMIPQHVLSCAIVSRRSHAPIRIEVRGSEALPRVEIRRHRVQYGPRMNPREHVEPIVGGRGERNSGDSATH